LDNSGDGGGVIPLDVIADEFEIAQRRTAKQFRWIENAPSNPLGCEAVRCSA
jgi:hypothetical protein